MNRWSFYDIETGEFVDCAYEGSPRFLQGSTPPGCRAIAGSYDRATQRVNVATGEVEMMAEPTRSRNEDPVLRQAAARARIAALERSQPRAIRELLLQPTDVDARARVQSIEDEIAALRTQLRK